MTKKKTALLTILLVCIILLIRKHDALLNPQFWAEDGLLFEVFLHDGMKSFFMPYAGYLNLFPRMIVWLASYFPLTFTPAIYNYTCFLVIVGVCAWLFSSRLNFPHKSLFALAIVLVPHGGESFLNLPNVYWFLSLGFVFLALQDHPQNIWQGLFDFLVLLLLGLSGPNIVCAVPLFAVRCLAGHLGHIPWRRKMYDYSLFFGSLLLVWAQFHTLSSTINPTLETGTVICRNFNTWVTVLGNRYAGGLFFGAKLARLVNPYLLVTLTLLLPLGLVILLDEKLKDAIRGLFAGRKGRLYTGTVFILFALGIAACVLFKHQSITDPNTTLIALSNIGNADRYFFIGYIMVLWTLILCLDSRPVKRMIAISLLVLSLVSSLTNFIWAPFTDYKWRDYIKRYGATISTQPVEAIRAVYHIPINPGGCFIETKLAANVVADFTFSFPSLPPGGTDVYSVLQKKLNYPLQKGDIVRLQVSPTRPLVESDKAYVILDDLSRQPNGVLLHTEIISTSTEQILGKEVNEPVGDPVLLWRNWKSHGSSLPETRIRVCVIRHK